jgi:hypothetical protein
MGCNIVDNKSTITMITLSFEVVLMKRGYQLYRSVLSKLEQDYGIRVFDCTVQPNYIKTVLKEVLGKNYENLIDDLEDELGVLSVENEAVRDFLLTLRK